MVIDTYSKCNGTGITVQDLIDLCNEHDISLNCPIWLPNEQLLVRTAKYNMTTPGLHLDTEAILLF